MSELAPAGRRIYFLHIPKTAGTSVASLVRSAYGAADSIPAYFWHELSGMDRAQLDGYQCYAGHFGTVLQDMLARPVATVTMLRDPLEHYVSRAAHNLRWLDQQDVTVDLVREQVRLATGDSDLTAAQADAVLTAARSGAIGPILGHPLLQRSGVDLQTRTLGVHFDLEWLRACQPHKVYEALLTERAPGAASEAVYRAAVASLEGMEAVGLVERMADSIALICRYLGIAAPSEVPLKNPNPARPQRHRSYRESGLLTTAQITMVESLTQRDRELYEHGRRLFERQRRAANRRWWWPPRRRGSAAALEAPR